MTFFSGWLGSIFSAGVNYTLPCEYEPRAPIAKDLLSATRCGSPRQASLMGRLHKEGKITPEKFQRYMEHLSRGIDFIHDRYGSHIDTISIIDDELPIHVNHDRDTKEITLVITLSDVEELCENYDTPDQLVQQSKTEPHGVTAEQMTTLYGVEEAYHAYQLRNHYETYQPHLQPLQKPDYYNADYKNNPIEKDAETIVRIAALSFGYWEIEPQPSTAPKPDNTQGAFVI